MTDLLEKVERELGLEMCRLTKENVPSLDELKRVVITPEDTEESAKYKEIWEWDDAIHYLGEVGCPICEDEKTGKLFLGKCTEPQAAAACNVSYLSCKRRGGRAIGSFHTHPLGGNTPSTSDMMCSHSKNEDVFCVGGRVGNEHRVACYEPNFITKRRGVFFDPFTGYYGRTEEKPMGRIRFWREPPPPTAEEINAWFTDSDIWDIIHMAHLGEKFTEKERKEMVRKFRKKLERGEIPEEYWETWEPTEGEWDELEVYTPEQQERIDKIRKRELSRDFFIREFRCGKE